MDGSDEWNSDVFGTIWNGVSLISAGTFLKFAIEFLGIGLVFLWKSRLSAFGTGNLIESDFLVSGSLCFSLGEKLNLDVSNEWDLKVFLSISYGVSLISAISFFEGGIFLGI